MTPDQHAAEAIRLLNSFTARDIDDELRIAQIHATLAARPEASGRPVVPEVITMLRDLRTDLLAKPGDRFKQYADRIDAILTVIHDQL